MRCRGARRRIPEARQGTLDPRVERDVRAHVDACARCAAEGRFERLLAEDGAILRELAPPGLDVTARVLSGIPNLPPPRDEVPFGSLGLALGAAAVAAGALLLVTVRSGPPVGDTAIALGALWESLLGLKNPILSLAHASWTLVRSIADQVARVVWVVAPLAQATALLALGIMAAATTVMLGRELRAAPAVKERG